MKQPATAESFGREVLGPIVAEFCLRLWSLASLMERREDVAMLFCARGGLRIQLAYERFLDASGLSSPVHVAPLMVSRVVAVRPALLRSFGESLDTLVPSAATALSYEFPHASLSEVARSVSGVGPATAAGQWDRPFTAPGFAALLRHGDGKQVAEAVERQADLFTRHLRECLAGRQHALLVDTGRYGTTRDLLAEGVPGVTFSSALIAKSYRPSLVAGAPRAFGLSVEAREYSVLHRRTAMLRYWHLIEWLFEPDLPSVRSFAVERGLLASNLQVDGWEGRVPPAPGTAFAGVVDYLEALPRPSAQRVLVDTERAWKEFRRAIVWPDRGQSQALEVGARSYDFGRDETWSEQPKTGVISALRGSSMWREGAIARSGSPLRWPLLAAIEAAYSARHLARAGRRVAAPGTPMRGDIRRCRGRE